MPFTLCAPPDRPTCFHCCPPIRSATHDTSTLDAASRASLCNHTENLDANLETSGPIDGRTCWGLGYLDRDRRSVGCLLHPRRNGGRDVRHLTGYQEKCRREFCHEARVFVALNETEQSLVLACSPDTDSFAYSSRIQNPLFRFLAWETSTVRAILAREGHTPLGDDLLLDRYGPLFRQLDPKIDGYCVAEMVRIRCWLFLTPGGLADYVAFRTGLEHELRRRFHPRSPDDASAGPMVHEHPISLPLSRWLKFGVGIWRAGEDEIRIIAGIARSRLGDFLED